MDQIYAKTIARQTQGGTIAESDYEEVVRVAYPTPCQLQLHVAVGNIVPPVRVYLIVRCGNGLTSWEERAVVTAWGSWQRAHLSQYICSSMAVQVALQSETVQTAEVTVSAGPLVAR